MSSHLQLHNFTSRMEYNYQTETKANPSFSSCFGPVFSCSNEITHILPFSDSIAAEGPDRMLFFFLLFKCVQLDLP